jgi:ABC transport system ATP-binding/permease protein
MRRAFTIHSRDGTAEFPITQAVVDVGRTADNDLSLPHATVSLHHARVLSDLSACRVMDLGSSNGTRLNGAELPVKVAQTLHEGDVVEIGPFQLRFKASAGRSPAPGKDGPSGAEVQLRLGHTVVLPPDLPARLLVSTPEWTREFPLKKDSVTLGRAPDNDIVIEAEAVSRHHAVMERRGSAYLVTDLGSTNGINIAGELVGEKLLAPGDHVCIGHSVTLEYRGAEALAADMAAAALARAGAAPEAAVYEIRDGDALVLGRGHETSVHLPHPQVSAVHAEVRRRADQYVIRDMGSSAGTYVNGQLVSRQALRENDVIRVGPNQLVFQAGQLRLVSEEGCLRLDAFHLSKVVGQGQRILDDVSLSIRPQEFVAVVGGSGAGKSTLVNALCGFKPATEGAVLLNGVDLYTNFDAYRNEMGYVPQDDIIHLDLPVSRALDYAARLRMPSDTTRREREQRVHEVIDELDLRACSERTIRQLSGGQRKRVSIGVELLTRPSLFFLDEATSGLDPATESQMMKLLRKLADQGRTIVLITHATKNVMACDKVVFLVRGGRLAYFGPPEDALRYFGVDEFDEIYERLESAATPEEWAQGFLASPELQEYVVRPLSEVAGAWSRPYGGDADDRARGGTAPPSASLRRSSSWHQFLILSARYLDIIRRDKKTLILLLAISPVLGVLDFVTWKRDLFDPVHGSATKVVTMLFMACLIGVLVGTITSVREIVKEDAIYRRERMVCVQVVPYVASKIAVGSIFAVYSGVVLFLFKIAAVDFGHLSAGGHLALLVTFLLCTFAGLMWGLLVSAVAPTEDRAMLLVILVLVPQFIFSGGMMPVADLGMAGKVFGLLTSTRWGLAAMATIARIKTGAGKAADMSDTIMPGIKGLGTSAEKVALVHSLDSQYGAIFGVDVAFYWAISVVLLAALAVVIFLLQKRKDTL